MRGATAVLCCLVLCASAACSTVEIVRLQPDILHTPKGTEPLAAMQVTCAGFYLFTLGLPEADLDRAINELLVKEAKKIGADRLVDLRFDVTPSHGLWFLTKILWVRVATAWAIAVVAEPSGDDVPWPDEARPGAGASGSEAGWPDSRPAGAPASAPAEQQRRSDP